MLYNQVCNRHGDKSNRWSLGLSVRRPWPQARRTAIYSSPSSATLFIAARRVARIGNAISIRIFSSKTTGPIFTEFLLNVVALVMLLNLAHTRRYPIPFLNDRAISAGDRQFCPIFAQNRLPWQRPLRYQKGVQIDHLHPKCFHSTNRLRKSVQRIFR